MPVSSIDSAPVPLRDHRGCSLASIVGGSWIAGDLHGYREQKDSDAKVIATRDKTIADNKQAYDDRIKKADAYLAAENQAIVRRNRCRRRSLQGQRTTHCHRPSGFRRSR